MILILMTAVFLNALPGVDCLDIPERVQIDNSITSVPSSNLGRIKAYINGTWGFICNEDPVQIEGNSAAIVVCNQLGFNGTNHVMFPVDFPFWHLHRDKFLLYGLNCVGNELSLEECQLGEWTNNSYCYTLAAVLCDNNNEELLEARLINGDKPNKGVIQVLYNGVWATMCREEGTTANNNEDFVSVICRQLGYTGMNRNTNFFEVLRYDRPDELIVRHGIPCDGSETHLDQCSSSIYDLEFGLESCSLSYEYECVMDVTTDPDTCYIEDVQLKDDGVTEGIPEVLYKGDCPRKWVHLCSTFHGDIATASVVCGMLGFQGNNHQVIYFTPGPTDDDSLIVTCNGFEETLRDCETIEASSWLFGCEMVLGVNCSTDIQLVPCPGLDGWLTQHGEDNNCFKLFHASDHADGIHWRDAEMLCQSFNSSLATIRDIRDADVVDSILFQEKGAEIRDKGVHIGLTLTNRGKTHRWVDGRPLSFAQWQNGNPAGGILEACTKLVYSMESEDWRIADIPCIAPETRYYMCMIGSETSIDQPIQVSKGPQCGKTMFTCTSGECIRDIYVCDDHVDCLDGNDEDSCVTDIPNANMDAGQQTQLGHQSKFESFNCASGDKAIPVSFVCDFIQHCPDNSDEDSCDYASCGEDQFKCADGQCIMASQRCDTRRDCVTGSDEEQCDFENSPSSFQCYDGRRMPREAVCDGQQDCLGLSAEDEPLNCEYRQTGCNETQLQCKNTACYDSKYECVYGFSQYGYPIGCRDVTHLEKCGDFECPIGTVKCPGSYCVQLQHVCNDIWDCPNGEEEQQCDSHECPGYYRCHSNTDDKNVCLTADKLCDGIKHCPLADDELFCGFVCPEACQCSGFSFVCNGTMWTQTHASALGFDVRQLDLTNREMYTTIEDDDVSMNDIILKDLAELKLLVHLNLTRNGINVIRPGDFSSNGNLRTLILQDNNINRLDTDAFTGLKRLEHLNLKGNPLRVFYLEAIFDLLQLRFLDIRESEIDVQESKLDQFLMPSQPPSGGPGMGGRRPMELQELETVYSDHYYFCCLVSNLQGAVECTPLPDLFSSCTDLLRYEFLSGLIWIIGLSALLGNTFVIIWRVFSRSDRKHQSLRRKDTALVQSILVTNLAISDGLMGIYLLIIASADTNYRGQYAFNAEAWQTSGLCKFAGILSVLSSEASVFFITIISLDRCACIVFPLSNAKLKPKRAGIAVALAWGLAFLFSIIPLLDHGNFGDVFYGQSAVCLALPLTSARPAGYAYSVALFIFINLAAFIIVVICYITIFIAVRKSSKTVGSSSKNRSEELQLAIRMALLIFTDFFCWMPIIILGLIALTDPGLAGISNEAYVWTAVFVLPLNSALNPYLYTIATREMRKYRNRNTEKVGQTLSKKPPLKSMDILPFTNHLVIVLQMRDKTQYRPYTVSSLMKEKISLSPADMSNMEADVKKALDYLHERGIKHGSISEDNVLIDKSDRWRGYLVVSPEIITQRVDTTKISSSTDLTKHDQNKSGNTSNANGEDDVNRIEFELNDIYEKDVAQLQSLMSRMRDQLLRKSTGFSFYSTSGTDSTLVD